MNQESGSEYCYGVLSDSSFFHLINHSSDYSIDEIPEISLGKALNVFDGICTDNGAQKSIAGLPSIQQYCSFTRSSTDLNSNKWKRPYKLYKYDNYKTAFVTIEKGMESFSITAAKKYLTEEEDDDGILGKESPRKLPDIGDTVEVFWQKDEKYYPVIIAAIGPETQKRHVDDGDDDKEILDFSKEKRRIIRAAGLDHEKCTINKVLTSVKQNRCPKSAIHHQST